MSASWRPAVTNGQREYRGYWDLATRTRVLEALDAKLLRTRDPVQRAALIDIRERAHRDHGSQMCNPGTAGPVRVDGVAMPLCALDEGGSSSDEGPSRGRRGGKKGKKGKKAVGPPVDELLALPVVSLEQQKRREKVERRQLAQQRVAALEHNYDDPFMEALAAVALRRAANDMRARDDLDLDVPASYHAPVRRVAPWSVAHD